MVTTFNKSDLVSFGNYLLRTQKEREQSLRNSNDLKEEPLQEEDLREFFKLISHADIDNWKAEQDKRTTRLKFECVFIDRQQGSTNVSFEAVIDGSPENKSFWKYTPAGSLNFSVTDEVDIPFREGANYYLDIKFAQ